MPMRARPPAAHPPAPRRRLATAGPNLTPAMGLRCAIVPPTPVPYREPLFAALHERPELDIRVIYQSAGQPSWDVAPGWFPAEHPYPAVRLRSWQRRRAGRTPMLWSRGLERALDEADPDCVVVSEYGPASLRALRWCRRHRRAYVIFTECTPRIDPMLPRWQLELHRRLAAQADGFIAVSSAARARLRAFGVPGDRIAVALQAADVKRFRAAATGGPAGARDAERPLTVLSVGRLVPDKNFATLITAFARTQHRHDQTLATAFAPTRRRHDQTHTPFQARLEIVGTGFLEQELRPLAAGLGAPVRFHGHVPAEELPALYAAADIYALVSSYEPFGVAIREAAAAGLPIICSRTAGAAGDVAIEGRNALLVDPESVEDVTAALDRLLASGELRREMGAQSRAIDAETDGRDVDGFIDAVLTAARRRGRLAPPADPHPPRPGPTDSEGPGAGPSDSQRPAGAGREPSRAGSTST
jgi:glycosyltransferase involved in cell wall biosynthesis